MTAVDPTQFTFLTVIGSRRVRGPWREWLTGALAARGITFAGEELRVGGVLCGFASLIDLADVAAVEPDAAWWRPSRCPWVGAPAGVFSWDHTDEALAKDRLVPALVDLGRGPFVRADVSGDQVRASVVRRRFPLSDLVGPHGFDDGAALLREDPEYLEDVRRAAGSVIRDAGYRGDVGTWPSHHNPLRLAGPLTRDGRAVVDPEAVLRDHVLEIWAHDWSILGGAPFWY